MDLKEALVELIRRTSTDLPSDVEAALAQARNREEQGSLQFQTFDAILENVKLARESSTPMCQDTGALLFFVDYPADQYSERELREAIGSATREASAKTFLRPNAVDSVTGRNSGDNTGINSPVIHFHQAEDTDKLSVRLLLKGGGSENVGAQYKLPNKELGAARDLEGVRKCVIDAIFKAQGLGCAPGIVGVAIGGNRDTGFEFSKMSLLGKLDEGNPAPELDSCEKEWLAQLNELGIGPMGFGGKTTVLGLKITALHRLPACFFVSVSYNCWACRRQSMIFNGGEPTYD